MSDAPIPEYGELARRVLGAAGLPVTLDAVDGETYDTTTRLMKPEMQLRPSVQTPLLATVTEHQIHVLAYAGTDEDGAALVSATELWWNGKHEHEATIKVRKLVHLLANITPAELEDITSRG